MIKKLALLLFINCFLWAAVSNNISTLDKNDKAEVKQIEQKIINDKYEEALRVQEELRRLELERNQGNH